MMARTWPHHGLESKAGFFKPGKFKAEMLEQRRCSNEEFAREGPHKPSQERLGGNDRAGKSSRDETWKAM